MRNSLRVIEAIAKYHCLKVKLSPGTLTPVFTSLTFPGQAI
ncbi:hypothetical protein FDUTEX481_00481 [Tolypothrix sp. PCC 7601]|nr:hypothetical protein FDUTEX481_00481 [Tolypothrix sp. PCC 7601]